MFMYDIQNWLSCEYLSLVIESMYFMPTTEEYRRTIQLFDTPQLIRLWDSILEKNTPNWPSGKAFEFLILRAFEIEGALIKWPYSVQLFDEVVEQIDGVIHLVDINLSILAEFKDYSKNLNIEPVAKLRNQLLRRPSGAIGAVFSTQGFTSPALTLTQFLAPQTILLWEKDHIEHCLRNKLFIKGMLSKYRVAIEEANYNYDVTLAL